MTRDQMIAELAGRIMSFQKDTPVLVGIDGIDASGKTTLANELAAHLQEAGHTIIRASIDGFHNPESVRYARGKDSPEGYYFDSFDYTALIDKLLRPLSTGMSQYQTAVFDYRTDAPVDTPPQTAPADAILIMEGVFMFRPELREFWDIRIFVDVDFETAVGRAVTRSGEQAQIGSEEAIRQRYARRYIPGQQLYFQYADPKSHADVIVNNRDLAHPVVTPR